VQFVQGYPERRGVTLRHAVKTGLRSSAGWRLARPVRRNPLIVLAYHRIGRPGDRFWHVDVDVFRAQMQWLRANCEVLGADGLKAAAGARRRRPHVLVTFDDGYRDYFELAYPVLKDLGVPAINFLSTLHIDEGRLFWWDEVTLAVERCPLAEVVLPWVPERRFDRTPASRFALNKAGRHWIADAPHAEHEQLLARFCEILQVDRRDLEAPRQVMTWDEVRAASDVTEYGGHTHTHARLSRTAEEKVDEEIATGCRRMEAELGVRPRTFAYPSGDPTEIAKRILRRHGFEVAFSVYEGYVGPDPDWLAIRRYPGPTTLNDLIWLATGWARGQ
jgi:peptidoglycan/xylan/chitin deacetylase (PgdA/CDA1 family)